MSVFDEGYSRTASCELN